MTLQKSYNPFEPEEQGWAGNVQEKPYRDGIDRMAKEGLS